MESHTRSMEVRDSKLQDSKILIISPPTDRGIGALTRANRHGESYLLCFTPAIARIADDYCRRNRIRNLQALVAPFFTIPLEDEVLGAIYANCFFDFCSVDELDVVVEEMWRTLRRGGRLYSVHMGAPSNLLGRGWAWLFRRFPGQSRGCHPVDIAPSLLERGFSLVREEPAERLGFPIRYVRAEKPIA